MNNKQLIYKLIDNKYNNNDISFLIDDLNQGLNGLENGIKLYNALKLNYKKYKHIINKIQIANNLYYYNNVNLNTNFYKYFIVNNNLNNITISGKLIDNDNLKILCSSLKNNLNLKVLDLSNNRITNIDILGEYLKNNTSLKTLYLYYNAISDFKNFFESIQNNKTLKKLDIRGNKGIYKQYKGDNSINYLNDVNKYLQNNNSLQELNIENIYDSEDIYEEYNNPYMIGYTRYHKDKYSYMQNGDHNFDYEYILNDRHYDMSNIFKTLEHNNTLKKITIDILSNTEYYYLCNMLKVNTSINCLYIIDNINKIANFNHDFHILFDILKYNNSIQDLRINIMKMNKKEIKSLSEMLKYNTSLKKLAIIINDTPYNDLYSIYKSLEFNKSLKELTIIDNIIHNNNIYERFDLYLLSKTLYFNKSIQQLNIYSNKIKNINLIQDILKNNHHIRFMNFIDNSFDENFYKELKKLLNLNKKFYNDY